VTENEIGSEEHGGAAGTVFRDVVLLALAGFVAIVLLLLPHVNPPGVAEEATDEPPGNVIVELFWTDSRDVDIDLWVAAPNDQVVGYSNRGAVYFNLLRDDLGTYRDTTPINYEVAYSRGISPGEHTANIHLYRAAPNRASVPVTVSVSAVRPGHRARKQLLQRNYMLNDEGQEITAARFAVDADGKLVPGSVHFLPRSLLGGVSRPAYRRPANPTEP